VMNQLTPLTECHTRPIYDFLTGNYYNYHAPVRIPPRLAGLLEHTVPWHQARKAEYPFGEVISLFQQYVILEDLNSSRIGQTPAIEVGEDSLVPILGGRVLARWEVVERLAKYLPPTSEEPVYWRAETT
jgi:hypothetical protein